jgi:uncharacterized protein (DUF362 family)
MVVVGDFTSYEETVPPLLDQLNIDWDKWRGRKFALKPNLVSYLPNPMTTDPRLVFMIAKEIERRCQDTTIFVIESCPLGATHMYHLHGYIGMEYPLIDVDRDQEYYESKNGNPALPTVFLPEIIKDAVLVSIANIKEHSAAVYTGAIKNLMGIVPTQHCTNDGIHKNKFHTDDWQMMAAIQDHKPIELAILDGSIGGRRNEFKGDPAMPPLLKMVAGENALEVDWTGAEILGISPNDVPHLKREGWVEV